MTRTKVNAGAKRSKTIKRRANGSFCSIATLRTNMLAEGADAAEHSPIHSTVTAVASM
jgi:hypothetical protein